MFFTANHPALRVGPEDTGKHQRALLKRKTLLLLKIAATSKKKTRLSQNIRHQEMETAKEMT